MAGKLTVEPNPRDDDTTDVLTITDVEGDSVRFEVECDPDEGDNIPPGTIAVTCAQGGEVGAAWIEPHQIPVLIEWLKKYAPPPNLKEPEEIDAWLRS